MCKAHDNEYRSDNRVGGIALVHLGFVLLSLTIGHA